MAVHSKIETDKIVLEIDNGDKQKIDLLMTRWGFNDYQSFLRFASSVLIDTQGNFVYLHGESGPVRVSPAAHLLKDKQGG